MAELRTFEFHEIDVLNFDKADANGKPGISPYQQWCSGRVIKHPVFESSQSLFVTALNSMSSGNPLEGGQEDFIHHIMDALYRSEPLSK